MPRSKIEELRRDVEELNQLSSSATRSKVKDILLIETRKIETEIIRLRELEEATSKGEACKVQSNPVSVTTKCYDVKLTNYAWDQSDKFVKIFVDLVGVHNLPNGKVACEFSSGEMKLTVPELDNRNYILNIKNLLFPIQPNSSHWKVKKDKVVVFMHKAKENKHWTSLVAIDKPAKNMTDMPPPNADPSEGLMSIMKQIYDDGDDEIKRNIAKAWAEGQKQKTPE